MTHICISKLTITDSDYALSLGRRQAIIWTNARILLNRHLGTNLSEILIEICIFFNSRKCVRMSAVAYEITSISIVQVQIKQNIKAPRHWPLQEEFTGDRWIPRKKAASNAENVSIRWRHYVKFVEGTSSWMISSIAFVKKKVSKRTIWLRLPHPWPFVWHPSSYRSYLRIPNYHQYSLYDNCKQKFVIQ